MDPLVTSIALLVAALVLCFLEIFIPSMGIITVFGLVCATASVIFGFRSGTAAGTVMLGLNIAGIPGAFVLGFKLLPHSPLRLKSRTVENAKYEPIQSLEGIDGAIGVAYTDLRPGGTALIKDKKIDVVTEGGYVDQGTRIKVLKIEGTKVVVRKETV